MKNRSLQELDVVALTADIPSKGLSRGQVGTIVHVYAPEVFEVEFIDNEGRTYGLLTLAANDLLRLQFSPAEAA